MLSWIVCDVLKLKIVFKINKNMIYGVAAFGIMIIIIIGMVWLLITLLS